MERPKSSIAGRFMDEYQSPRRPELGRVRIRICESEIQAFIDRFPRLSRESVFREMSRAGPDRAAVETAIRALANRHAPQPHPSESVLRKL
jgi:hypothetical protein